MRIALCSNYSHPNVGGSEKVILQISESMVLKYGHTVRVFSLNVKNSIEYNGVSYCSCNSFPNLLHSLIKFQPDHTLVYSDCFVYWDEFVKHSHEVPGRKSIALVGMNHMRSKLGSLIRFREKLNQFTVITHSNIYDDYITCSCNNIPVTVIPNGIGLREFDNNTSDFRKKYSVSDKHIILCVSNYFPGKGQEYLTPIYLKLKEKRSDWVAVMISSTVNFGFAGILEKNVKNSMSIAKIPVKFFKDLPREDVVGAFKQASVFAFPSQKEVAPIVVIEAQACCLPWVSMPVGNVRDLRGGVVAPYSVRNHLGFIKCTGETQQFFVNKIDELISNEEKRVLLGGAGRKQIVEDYNWDKIADKYNEVFSNARPIA